MVIGIRGSARPNPVDDQVDEHWRRLWSHREALLRVARRRSASIEDAEDAVHEAMLRAAEHPDVDVERLGAWLTTVTMRLCVDRYRQVCKDDAAHHRTALAPSGPVPVDEFVCDRAEAEWLADRSKELPARQAKALLLKSDGRDVDQIAQEMGLSYEAVESLLARARRALRRSLAATMAVALGLWIRGKGLAGGGAAAAAVVSVTSATAVGVFVAGDGHFRDHRPPAPVPAGAYGAAAPALPGRGSAGAAAVPVRPGRGAGRPGPVAGKPAPAGPSDAVGDPRPRPGPSATPEATPTSTPLISVQLPLPLLPTSVPPLPMASPTPLLPLILSLAVPQLPGVTAGQPSSPARPDPW